MIKIKVIALGKCKEPWLQTALSEYEKRLSPYAKIVWQTPKDIHEMEEMARQEDSPILLDPEGESLDSIEFSQKFHQHLERNGARLSFLIGGPDGYSAKILQMTRIRWSLSRLTFTHQMTRLILIEQIYRSFEIYRGSPYHK